MRKTVAVEFSQSSGPEGAELHKRRNLNCLRDSEKRVVLYLGSDMVLSRADGQVRMAKRRANKPMSEQDLPLLSDTEAAALRAVGVEPYPVILGTARLVWRVGSVDESAHLPGLDAVLRVLRPELHEAHIIAFLDVPQSDLEDDAGGAMSPRAWLLSGRDVETVMNLARGL